MNTMDNIDETVADIIREMREQANEPTIESLGEVFYPVGPEDVKDWANRLEGINQRDRVLLEANIARVRDLEGMLDGAENCLVKTAVKQYSIGDAALREAAEKLLKYLPKFLEAIDYYGIDGYYREPYKQDIKELRGRMNFLKTALAASEYKAEGKEESNG